MEERLSAAFWQRFQKTTGFAGVLAFLLVFFAASLNGRFDWGVFFVAGAALLVCWARTWVLVPIHMRHENAEKEMWGRYYETDLHFARNIADLSGSELEELRSLFQIGEDTKVREWIQSNWDHMDSKETQEFIRVFSELFMDMESAYIDDSGRLQPFD
ncbi:hypothetical protein [uncultured Sulfitobacter sp.]|uniref:hypothetical protein n=1 Tax=uncultured Sulfitobacter sp. TaxID=191468 RepID=UPI00262C1514|nr:hypothetical protein [uncultured Sulfitobacter sp.]